MTKKKILIVTDSRGAGLQQFLAEKIDSNNTNIKVLVYRGAKLETLCNIVECKYDSSLDLVILSGGICDLTIREKEKGVKTLVYQRTDGNLDRIKDILTRITGKPGLRGKITITTIPPASLHRYFRHHNANKDPPPQTQQQQQDLLQDIQEINECIITLNKAANLKTIDLHDKCFRKSLAPKSKSKTKPIAERRRKIFQDHFLSDGVHANLSLQSKWFTRYAEIISVWLSAESSSGTEEDGPDRWDYKRHAHGGPKSGTSKQ